MTSSISRNSPTRDVAWPGRRHWLTGALVGVLFLFGLQWVSSTGPDEPELRLAATNRAISAQIVDGNHRVVVLNATGPRDARSVLGKLNPPWEPRPSTLIVDADAGDPGAIWEAIQRLDARQILVAGAPGDSDEWNAIDRRAREQTMDVRYLENRTHIRLDRLEIVIFPSGAGPGYVEISRGEVRMAVALSGLPEHGRYHLSASDERPGPGLWSDFAVIAAGNQAPDPGRVLTLNPGERVDAVVEPDAIRLRGEPARQFQGTPGN